MSTVQFKIQSLNSVQIERFRYFILFFSFQLSETKSYEKVLFYFLAVFLMDIIHFRYKHPVNFYWFKI